MAIRRRGKKWIADYYDAFRVRRWVTCNTRADAVDAAARGNLQARQAARPSVSPDITVEEHSKRWLTLIAGSLKPRTVNGYREKLTNHPLPAIGARKVLQLDR